MKPSSAMARWSLAAAVLVILTGCGSTRNPNGMVRNDGVGRALAPPPAGVSAASAPERDLRTPQEILEGQESDYHPQLLPGFAREAVPNRVMLQEQANAGYSDSLSPVD